MRVSQHWSLLLGIFVRNKHCVWFQTDWRWLRQFYYETVLTDLEEKVGSSHERHYNKKKSIYQKV